MTDEEQQEEQEPERERVLAITTYDTDPRLTAEEARNERARAESESSDD